MSRCQAVREPRDAPPPETTAVTRRRRPLWGLLTATASSVAANAMVAVLVPWLVLTRTGSGAQAGLVGAVALAAAIPALLLGGPLIDRWGRRAVSVGADLMSAVAVAALPVLGATVGLSLVTILAAVAAGALFDAPGAAAREVARPQIALATGADPDKVNARGEAMEGVGAMAGPALAGAGLGLLGAMSSLWLAVALFLVAAVASWRSLPGGDRLTRPHPSLLTAARAGLRVVVRHPALRAVALIGAVGMACVAPLVLVLADLMVAAGDPGRLGAVTAALAVGSITGALAYGRWASRTRRHVVLVACVTVTAAGVAAMAALSSSAGLVAAAALTGLALGPVNPVLAAVTQDATDPAIRGRAVTLVWSLSLIASPASVAVAGILLDLTGPATVLLIIAAGLTATAACAAATPGLRRVERHDLIRSRSGEQS